MITEEERKLLLKDLSARLPYGVIVEIKGSYDNGEKYIWEKEFDHTMLGYIYDDEKSIKPYLRPMSSMTEEEEREVGKLGVCYDGAFHNDIYDVGICMEEAFTAISWLLERHFDINYLIQKGLALEAPEGMYEIK